MKPRQLVRSQAGWLGYACKPPFFSGRRAKMTGFPLLGITLVVLACSSCGPSVKLVPVNGRVTVNGKPVTVGVVCFYPQSEEPGHRVLSQSKLSEDGSYELFTERRKGAPLGQFRVTVLPPRSATYEAGTAKQIREPRVLFNIKYQNPVNSPLVIEVVESPKPSAYDLDLAP